MLLYVDHILIMFFGQVPGNDNPSVLISFASKTLNAGQIISKLHVIELGAQPGLHIFTSFTSISHVFLLWAIWLLRKTVL